MKNNDAELMSFSRIMWGVAEDFGGKISEDGMLMRFNALEEYSIEQISKAGTWLLKHRKKDFPPVPTTKEFVDAITGLSVPVISPQAKAQIQVDEVLKKLKLQGRDAPLDFQDPITLKLMSTRWHYPTWAATVTIDELERWWPKKFIDAYLAYDEREEAERIALPVGPDVVQLESLAKKIGREL